MNYRHAFHAGNAADVVKHVVLVRLLEYLLRKAKPFRVIDTHAGIGRYDLSSEEAQRTGEWRDGIARMEAPFTPQVEALLAPYRALLSGVRERFGDSTYPGSPQIFREKLRPSDQAILVEQHPHDSVILKTRYSNATALKVIAQDGWTVLPALIPPPERRGLVFLDPSFEQPDEHDRLATVIAKAWRKWREGLYVGWHPLKEEAPARKGWALLCRDVSAPMLRIEALFTQATNEKRLRGCGLWVVNPPFVLANEMSILLPALTERLVLAGPVKADKLWLCERHEA
jgi:23S rRNA (adenine2030-N6)-methyltransferase